ncbi:MAG TPA: hypothetical protein VJ623_05460 [Holophagaceae bacterium]|nr:hypothetical protein [Holophagaceae bacterium]
MTHYAHLHPYAIPVLMSVVSIVVSIALVLWSRPPKPKEESLQVLQAFYCHECDHYWGPAPEDIHPEEFLDCKTFQSCAQHGGDLP